MEKKRDERDMDKVTPEEGSDEEPQVYAVERDLNGWRFSRRKFLTASGTAAAALLASAAGCGGGEEASPTDTPSPTDTLVPTDTLIPTHTRTATAAAAPTETFEPTDTLIPVDEPASSDTPGPSDTPMPEDTATPAESPTATKTPRPQLPKAQFVADVTVPDGTVMTPGQSFTKTWRVKNSGAVRWGEGTQLVFASGARMGASSPVSVDDVAPGDTTEISVDMTAPQESGKHTGRWTLKAGDGTAMLTLTVSISVEAEEPGEPGEVPPGETGVNVTGPGGETRTMPCGSPIPPGWTCTCNCVSVPAGCSCDGHCTCDQVCTCDAVCTCQGHGHYWYPC